jgi:hypothetical protein
MVIILNIIYTFEAFVKGKWIYEKTDFELQFGQECLK